VKSAKTAFFLIIYLQLTKFVVPLHLAKEALLTLTEAAARWLRAEWWLRSGGKWKGEVAQNGQRNKNNKKQIQLWQ
jgi:hypothetical protein